MALLKSGSPGGSSSEALSASAADKNTPNNVHMGPGVTFTGSITAPGLVTIEGTVSGEVQADGLVVGPTGEVSGQIAANVINVHGKLAEQIAAAVQLMVHASGKVNGNVEYREIEILRGGTVSGQLIQLKSS